MSKKIQNRKSIITTKLALTVTEYNRITRELNKLGAKDAAKVFTQEQQKLRALSKKVVGVKTSIHAAAASGLHEDTGSATYEWIINSLNELGMKKLAKRIVKAGDVLNHLDNQFHALYAACDDYEKAEADKRMKAQEAKARKRTAKAIKEVAPAPEPSYPEPPGPHTGPGNDAAWERQQEVQS